MNVLVFAIFLLLTAQTEAIARKLPPDPQASGQQCISCQGENCNRQPAAITYCSQECATMVNLGSGDKPNYDAPYIAKGCSDAIWFHPIGGCRNKCYDERQDVGDKIPAVYTLAESKIWMCLYCCTGDKCNEVTPRINAGLQMNGNLIATTMQVTLSLTLVHVWLP